VTTIDPLVLELAEPEESSLEWCRREPLARAERTAAEDDSLLARQRRGEVLEELALVIGQRASVGA